MRVTLRPGVAVLACALSVASAAAASDATPVEARVVASASRLHAGTPVDVGVLLRIRPGWHVYWLNPGDAGLPTSIRWSAPAGFTVGPVRWPLPERFEQPGGGVGYGYRDGVLLASSVTPPPDLPPGDRVPLRADVAWLACEHICVRGKAALELPFTDGATDLPRVEPELFARWASRVPVDSAAPDAPATITARGTVPPGGAAGTITVTLAWRQAPAAVEWFPPDDPALDVQAHESRTSGSETRLTLRARRLPGVQMAHATLESVVTWRDGAGARHGMRVPIDLGGKET